MRGNGEINELERLDSESPESIFATVPQWDGGHPAPLRPRRRRRRSLRTLAILLGLCLGGYVLLHLGGGPNPDLGLGGVPAKPTMYADGHYEFLQQQAYNPSLPVGYNPCRKILVEINYANATPDIYELTRSTLAQINRASGLRLEYVGASQQRRSSKTLSGRILVAFDNIAADRTLTDAAANGGSDSYADIPDGLTKYYVGGTVTLNTAEFNHYSHHSQALVLAHEFGHALGLGHSSGDEVMSPGNYDVKDWGHGDLTGLAKLGALPCR